MKKILIIFVSVILFFLLELFFYNLLGRNFTPSLLFLLVMFFNLYLGIRYSIIAALLAGLIKDSFSPQLFGVDLFSFILCAYMTTLLKSFVYHMGSNFSRLLLIFFVFLIYILINYAVYALFMAVPFKEFFMSVFIPQMLITLLVANFTFDQLRKCVSRLSV